MATTPINNLDSIEILQAAYDIGRFIQSFADQPGPASNKPQAFFSPSMTEGPEPSSSQTRNGLILECEDMVPARIVTPYGTLHVIHSTSKGSRTQALWEEVMAELRGAMELNALKRTYPLLQGDEKGRMKYAILEWNGLPLPEPSYRNQIEKISDEKIDRAWKKVIKQ